MFSGNKITMRLFSDIENELIQSFVDIKNKGIKYIADLQIARILRTKIPFMCLSWDNEEKVITIISPKGTPEEQCDKFYYEIVDCIEFIKELEQSGFICIQNLTSKNEVPKNILLYDRSKYSEAKELLKDYPGIKISGRGPIMFEKSDNNVQFLTLTENPIEVHLDFINDLNKYGYGIIYPLPLAEDYVKNNFKSLEERHHEAEMKVALKSVKWSQRAAFIALITLFLSVIFDIKQMCSPQKIDTGQITTIETAIKNNHLEEPLKVEIKDTILTRAINNK